jgi:hypothetical protein
MIHKKRWNTPVLALFTVLAVYLFFTGCHKDAAHDATAKNVSPTAVTPEEEEDELQMQLGTFLQVNTYLNFAEIALLKGQLAKNKTQTNAVPPDLGGFELGWPDSPFCNTHITTDTAAGGNRITIAYDNKDCSGKLYLKGTVVIQQPPNMDVVGSAININIQHVQVSRLSDGHIAFVDGHINLINAYGGSLKDSSNYPNSWFNQYVQSDDMSISYPATHTVTSWQMDLQRTYAGYYNNLLVTTQGHRTQGNEPFPTVAAQGTDRYGRSFTWRIPAANVNQENQCQWKFTNGQLVKTYDSLGVRIDISLGVSASGTYPGPVCSQPLYYKYQYTSGDTTYQHILPEPSF